MTNPHLEEVYEKYWNAFETFRKIPMIRTMEDNEEFCLTLKRLLDDHLTIIPSLTIGVVESSHHLPPDQLDAFMERMLRSRISRRVLAEQHIALSDALDDPFHFFNDGTSIPDTPSSHDGDHIGIIYTNLKVSSVVSKVVRLLTNVFQDEVRAGYRVGDASVIPEVVIDGALDTRFAYIPEHLEYIFFELLKNSMMAVMRQPLSARDPVTIRVTIVEGPPDEDLIVRVSDCGGGLPDLLTKLNTQNARREHRRKHQHRSVSRRRKEVLDDESASVAHHGQSSRHGRQRQPHSSASSEGQLDPQVMMDSTLAEDQSSSIAAAMEADHARGEIDIAMSSAKHAVPPVTREGTAVSGASANRAGSTDPLIAAVTSFSNVRRRLEIEDEELRRSVTSQHDADQSSDTSTPADAQPNRASAESPGREKEALGMGLRASVGGERGTGIDSRAKLDALRNVGRFKGTVAEQLATHDAQQRQSGAQEAEELADAVALTLGGDLRSTLARQETGLGLPMTKIYTDFFGGSLNLRSLDGHGMDVYVRLPKLGTNKGECVPYINIP